VLDPHHRPVAAEALRSRGTRSRDGLGVPYARPIAAHDTLATSTPVFSVHLPPRNLYGTKGHSAEVAAHDYGLLLSGLCSGMHTVRVIAKIPKTFSADVTVVLVGHGTAA
jgi:hypothetical protein